MRTSVCIFVGCAQSWYELRHDLIENMYVLLAESASRRRHLDVCILLVPQLRSFSIKKGPRRLPKSFAGRSGAADS